MRDPRRSDPFADLYGELADRLRGDRWRPDVDVVETESDVVVRVELAGVRSEEVRVTVDAQVLRIAGVRARHDAAARRLHQMEIASGPFERLVQIPVPCDREHVRANLSDGFLTVTLKKRSRRRKVEVEPG